MDAPSVAVSHDGKKVATAWMDQRTGERAAYLLLPSGQEVRLGAANASQSHPNVTIDAEQGTWAVWEERGGAWGRSPSGEVTQLASAGQFPVVAWSEKTGALVAWEVEGGALLRRWP